MMALLTFLHRFANQWLSLPAAPRVNAGPTDLPTQIPDLVTKSFSRIKKVTIWRNLCARFNRPCVAGAVL